ncbi:hypothetical protein K461DRAFT_280139 [Myriangium duriaei CBS 260.36]|uniref:Alcohol acetyltransferase n=1 Tax=Myriangium duriaei CBS 260.36 TaxID=1168546 RepID=A0A9P4MIS4_9PEZI|nr:hypothetical protein K461DRAFT_280139 [Myriangium duriaei CBS 260.36]
MQWLDRYASDFHKWRSADHGGRVVHYRPLGVIESSFDADGLYYEGRADIKLGLSFEIKTNESKMQLRERIILAITCLRLHHTMLATKADRFDSSYMDSAAYTRWDRYFLIDQPTDPQDALRSAEAITTFVADHYPTIDPDKLHNHARNSSRVVTPDISLTRLLVLPMTKTTSSTHSLRFIFVMAHQIADGLTTRTWQTHFLDLLNTPLVDLRSSIPSLIQSLPTRLIPPQEALYPHIPGSKARQRWFWAITLALRHVRRPPPDSFPNPLYRTTPAPATLPSDYTFSSILPYTRPPSLSAGEISASIPPSLAAKLHTLCRSASSSVGAGLFVLIALSMMDIHSHRFPSHPPQPFVGSFPINPRPLLPRPQEAESCMLAFSSGVTLPYLPPSLPLAGRIKLLVRAAQRQLSRYQKRPPAPLEAQTQRERDIALYGPNGPKRVLMLNYLDALERVDAKLPPEYRLGLRPGGEELAPKYGTLATCGVSSVGRADGSLFVGKYDLGPPLKEGEGSRVDFRGSSASVRPREGEFLVGISGTTEGGIGINVSYDACAVDEVWAERWKERVEGMLGEVVIEEKGEDGRARL